MKAMNVSCRTLLVLLVIVFVGMGTVTLAAVPQVGDVIVGTCFSEGVGIANWSTNSLTPYLLGNVSDLAYGPDGDLYVDNTWGSWVERYRGSTLIDTYNGLEGTSIAVRSDGTVLGIDTTAQAVKKWSGTGWVNFATGPALTAWGRMTFGPDGNLYVATTAGIYSCDGQTGGTLSLFASKSGVTPSALAFRPTDGNLYVGTTNGRIEVFNGSTGAWSSTANYGDFVSINDLMWGPDRSGDGVSDLYLSASVNEGVWATASGAYPYSGYVHMLNGTSLETRPVPEPSVLVALSMGLIGLVIRRRK